jgi:S1-C subfamily serine protease
VVAVVLHIFFVTLLTSAAMALDGHIPMWRITELRSAADATNPAINEHEQRGRNACGWIGVQVRPMTKLFAASLGMAVPHGAIFEQPEGGSPAANAGIHKNDVITTINGSPLTRSSDFLPIISRKAPGTRINLITWRNRHLIRVRVRLGSSVCP